MKKSIIIILLFFYSSAFFAQKKQTRTYMPLNQYKKLHKKNLTKKDSINFLYHNNDTLILLSNKETSKNKNSVIVPYEPKDSTFLSIYKDVVYATSSNKSYSEKQRMRLWKEDIKIFITENVNKNVKKELKKFAKYLDKEVDSLNIKFVNNINKSNYLIYGINSEKDRDFETRLNNKTIDFYISWNGKQQFYDVKLKIDARRYTDKNLILLSKIMFFKSLGRFFYTNKLPKESYLSSSINF